MSARAESRSRARPSSPAVRDLAASSPLSAAAVLRGGRRVPPAVLGAARTVAGGALRAVFAPPPDEYRSPPASLSIFPNGAPAGPEAVAESPDGATGVG